MAGSDRAGSKVGDREKSLETALAQIERQFGRGSIMRLGDETRAPIEVIPTGAISLDVALGIGGLPRGRVVEIYGPESSGKTTVCQHVIAEAQQRGGVAAFIDVEHALDPHYARACGVNVDELLVSQPDTGEQALEITERIRQGISQLAIPRDGSAAIRVTISIGVAVPSQAHRTVDDLLAAADHALYQAKRGGRDRVVMHADTQVPQASRPLPLARTNVVLG